MRRHAAMVVAAAVAIAGAMAAATVGPRMTDTPRSQREAAAAEAVGAVTPAPIGLKKYMVFMADGVVDSLAGLAGDGESFHRNVMGRTPAEIDDNKREAADFFRQRFGLDFSTGDVAGGVKLLPFAIPSKINLRAYTISGESIPATGWEVRDGGWAAMVGPGGATLYGAWGGVAGTWVPEGTSMPFGEYSIDVEALDGSHGDPIVLRYQGFTPVAPMVGSTPMFNCELNSAEFGRGQALGVFDVRVRGDGTVHMLVRNVLTFT